MSLTINFNISKTSAICYAAWYLRYHSIITLVLLQNDKTTTQAISRLHAVITSITLNDIVRNPVFSNSMDGKQLDIKFGVFVIHTIMDAQKTNSKHKLDEANAY